VLVLGHGLWRSRFGGDPNVIGRTVRLDDEPYEIVGVLPADFAPEPGEWAFAALEPWADNKYARIRANHQGIYVLGRLRESVSLEEAVADVTQVEAQLEAQYPDTNGGIGVVVQKLRERQVEGYAATLWVLLGAVTLVLLIACANVANLLLARSVSRRREVAIQAALGASRWRLLRQGLTEGVTLALTGGLVGIPLAFAALALLRDSMPGDVPRLDRAGLDVAVLAYSFALALATGLVFGAAPALVAVRTHPGAPLGQGGRSTRRGGRAGRILLVAEVALATLLLIGSGLLIRTVDALTHVAPGFRSDRLLTFQLGVAYSRYEGPARDALFRDLEQRLGTVPGVRSVTLGLNLPMMGASWSSIFVVDDRTVPRRDELPSSIFTPVEPSYFSTLEIPLKRGRLFDDGDDGDAPEVVVVNETLAHRLWPGESPLGKRLKQGLPREDDDASSPWREIVGVVGDVKQFGLGEATQMQVYLPARQEGLFDVSAALRTAIEPLSLVEPVKSAVRDIDPDIPLYDVKTMESVVSDSIAPRRFTMMLFGLFALLALFLASIGLYGVIAYSVARRTAEIGLRMSVGASRTDIFRLVLRQGMLWAVLGAVVGLLGGVTLTRLLEGLLYGVAARDAVTFVSVPLVLLGVAALACAVPAIAATRIDPIRALRYE
jgi:putative ABC transport system permease protein